MSNDKLVQILILLAGVIVILIIILIIALIAMNIKEKRKLKKEQEKDQENKQVKKSQIIYTPESILDFMQFEKIEDNMIIQKNGKFIMVVECKGINYDLMSEMEKVSVEQGFIAFLNTLRHPIQIYVQTRTINLERSIDGYKARLKEIERRYLEFENQYERVLKDDKTTKEEVDRVKYELVKQKNLKEYTEDIIKDIEKQSLNKSILNKKYYIIIPCRQSEVEAGDFDKSEIKNMAFSELYTRARAIINSLFSCQVNGRVLTSEELVELLYVAYNRDESDLFWMDKIKQAGFEELYSTAPDVLDKKLKLLNKQIEEEAALKANKKINEARRDIEITIAEKMKAKDELVDKRAKDLIKRHSKYIGKDVAEKAIDKIDGKTNDENISTQKEKDKEEKPNVNIKKESAKRGRPKKTE